MARSSPCISKYVPRQEKPLYKAPVVWWNTALSVESTTDVSGALLKILQ